MANFNISQQNVLERIFRESVAALRDEFASAGTPVEERPAWLPVNSNEVQDLLGQFTGHVICSRTDETAARKAELEAAAERALSRGLKYGQKQYRAGLMLAGEQGLAPEESAGVVRQLQQMALSLGEKLGIELPDLDVTETRVLLGTSGGSKPSAPARPRFIAGQ